MLLLLLVLVSAVAVVAQLVVVVAGRLRFRSPPCASWRPDGSPRGYSVQPLVLVGDADELLLHIGDLSSRILVEVVTVLLQVVAEAEAVRVFQVQVKDGLH
eukprot:5428551-Pyramimonas_sp.AAC.1